MTLSHTVYYDELFGKNFTVYGKTEMTERPEYIRCIQHTHTEKQKTSWCGKQVYSFDLPFQDIDHATYSVMNGSRLVPCPECINAITELLKND